MNVTRNIANAQTIIGYVYKNKTLCAEALQMAIPSMPLLFDGKMHLINLNTRLAVQGDAGAAVILCKRWYKSHDHLGNPQTPEIWDSTREATLSNASLAKLARSLDLPATITTAAGHRADEFGDKMLGTALEALLGAVYRDGGESALEDVMGRIELMQQAATLSFRCP